MWYFMQPKPRKRSSPKGKKPRKPKKLLFVTSNRHKFSEFSAILRPLGIALTRKSMGFVERQGTTVGREAVNKARQAWAKFKQPLMVEDTGFYFTAYPNFPGAQPKRMFDALGYGGMLKLLSGKERGAYSEVVLCYISSQRNYRTFSGRMHGTITTRIHKPRADVMPYEHIFRMKGERRVVAEMSREEKNAVSHRAKAAKKMARYLMGKKR